MQPNSSQSNASNNHSLSLAKRLICRISRKEVTLFFASPTAYLFLAVFAGVSLFVFFWGEAFFSRNIADVRPLFEWMPILLIFLCSTITMRLWSEERRTGTIEHVLTQPVPLIYFVLGKFSGCLILLAAALAITLPLPITVAILGDLDWGPVFAGYVAAFLLGAAYLSIGLFVSSRSDNPIVSLIISVAVCGAFYLIGSSTLTNLFGNATGEWLRLFGSGSRFDAITRGVIDFRDLYYYLSLIAVFLCLNTYFLEKERWDNNKKDIKHHRSWQIVSGLVLANALFANLWLSQITSLRMDATAGSQYSLSSATDNYLKQLREPLLLRGYFSGKTHPLLAPLVPQIRDLLREYEIAADGKVRVEFIDPVSSPELEEEANQKYGIEPVPFQVADRYQAAIVNSYFNVLVQYGDQYQVLGFQEFIEVKASAGGEPEVQLRNPELDLTRAIKKVLNTYQSEGNLFDTVAGNLTFKAYISADDKLPEALKTFKQTVLDSANTLAKTSQGRLTIQSIDPDANQGVVGQQIAEDYGFQPMATSLFSDDRFYFYLTVQQQDQIVNIPLDDMTEGSFERNLDAAVKRFARGFTKTIAVVAPAPEVNPQMAQFGMPPQGPQFSGLEQFLGAELNIVNEDISDGQVRGDTDLLLLLAPKDLDEKQVFAVDQFLMQGGTVIAATSPFTANLSNRSLMLNEQTSGLEDWLTHHGITIEKQLVLDPQNSVFPLPVTRNVGGLRLQELRMVDYPYFIDVRGKGLTEHPITTDLPQLSVAWASPISIAKPADESTNRKTLPILSSSKGSWVTASTNISPRVDANGMTRFTPEGDLEGRHLGVLSSGRFESFFANKPSPLLEKDSGDEAEENSSESESADKALAASSVIERSPESARLIVFSSNDFLRDTVLQIAGSAGGSQYLNSVQMIANATDWALEDGSLLSIRARSHFNRTLPPMEHGTQLFWEYLNYFLAAMALFAIAWWQRRQQQKQLAQYRADFYAA